MNVTFSVAIVGWQIATLNIRVDPGPAAGTCQPAIDRGVKRLSRWWTRRMTT